MLEDLVESGILNQIKQFSLEFHCWKAEEQHFLKMIKAINMFEQANFVKVKIQKLIDDKEKEPAIGEIPRVANMLLINKRFIK